MTEMLAGSASRHSAFEDLQGILTGATFAAFGVLMFRQAGLLTGGTTGLAFLLHYAGGWRLGLVLFLLNLPFYVFGWRALGATFMLKTFVAVGLLSLLVEVLPRLVSFATLDPVFAALMAGLCAGAGILMLIRHGASLGGVTIVAVHLQRSRGIRAGTVQMSIDAVVMLLGLTLLPPSRVLLSVLGAVAVNFVIGINHRRDRYIGGL